MKRVRDNQTEVIDSSNLATILMLLSSNVHAMVSNPPENQHSGRVFECKTCKKTFPSFQALGGHRASHKKPRLVEGAASTQPSKPRVHECSICGLEFPLGQALGGHMRRHRAELDAAAPRLDCAPDHNPSRVKEVKDPKENHKVEVEDTLRFDLNMPAPPENSDPMLNLCLGLSLVH